MGLVLLGIAPVLVLVDCSSGGLVVAICNAGLEGAGGVVTAGVCGTGWPAPAGTDGGNARADGEDALNDMGGSCGPVPFCCCCGTGGVAVCGCGRCGCSMALRGWSAAGCAGVEPGFGGPCCSYARIRSRTILRRFDRTADVRSSRGSKFSAVTRSKKSCCPGG